MAVHPNVEREMIARPGRNAHEREVVHSSGRGHDRQGPVATGHTEGIGAAGHRCLSQRCQVLAGRQNDGFNTLPTRSLNDPAALGGPTTGPGIDKQHRLPRAAYGPPAATQQLSFMGSNISQIIANDPNPRADLLDVQHDIFAIAAFNAPVN